MSVARVLGLTAASLFSFKISLIGVGPDCISVTSGLASGVNEVSGCGTDSIGAAATTGFS